ncbi:MAG: glycosyltransferase family 4 protein [Sulfolobus sp.]
MFVIPNFIDLKKYELKDKNIDNKFKIISPGVSSKEKGVDVLFRVADVLRNFKDIEFYVTGHKYTELNLPENVKYIGFLKEVDYIKVISNASLLFLPTRAEAFSFTVLENLAVGNPVVVTNLPDVRSAFGETKAIYYSKMNNIKDYLNGIFKYYYLWRNNVEKYKEISNVAKQIATNFDSEIILPKIEEMFKIAYEEIK